MKLVFGKLIAIVALVLVMPALAHHSYAMFDRDKKVTLSGTVKEFQWTNPHAFIQLLVPAQANTGTEEWSIEMGAPAHLMRAGWKHSTLKPGDKITVVFFPLRVGTYGGAFVSASGADGKLIGAPSEIKP